MKIETFLEGVLLGAILGIVLHSILLYTVPSSPIRMIQEKINECEKDLPRSQKCVIIAVPKQNQ